MRSWKGAFVALFVSSWAGNQFTPLLLLYKQNEGYSTVIVNTFLGVYVLGLAPSLLIAGPLSDRYGRRPVMFAGSIFALATSVVLALGSLGAGPLYLGRLLAGITVGTAMAVGTSWLKELSQAPYDLRADAGSGARRASLAFSLGSALGALVAGVLAQWGPAPEILPYLAHIVIAIPPLILVRRIPETVQVGAESLPLHRGVRVPAAAHRRFRSVVVVAAPWIFGAAALAYGYVPLLLKDQIQGFGIAYATLLTVVSLTVAALVQPIAKGLDAVDTARGLITAMIALTISVAGVGIVALTGSPVLGVVTAATAGAGIGIALSTGLLEVQRIAGKRHLAGLTGVFYAVAYLGFLTPTAMAAITPPFTTMQLFGGLTVLAIASTAVVATHSRRHLPSADDIASAAA